MRRKPDINAIKKMLEEKQKAKENAEKEAKEIEDRLNKQKDETVIETKVVEKQNVQEKSKIPRFSFIRKDIGKVEIKNQDEKKPQSVNLSTKIGEKLNIKDKKKLKEEPVNKKK